MSDIRELNISELALIGGGNANGNYERGNSAPRGSAPATQANNAGMGAILGTIGAVISGAGPGGVIAGAIIGGLGAALPSPSDNGNRGGGWHDTNPGGMVGQCRW